MIIDKEASLLGSIPVSILVDKHYFVLLFPLSDIGVKYSGTMFGLLSKTSPKVSFSEISLEVGHYVDDLMSDDCE